MSSFAVNIINHTLPAVSVTVADSGVPPLTYSQIKNSLGNQVYNIGGLYIYSTNLSQLISVIQYNRYDVSGNQSYKSATITVDPYQRATAVNIDLTKYESPFILNGNSSLSTVVLANAYIQFTMHCQRIKNSYGLDVNNFELMEKIFRKDFFTDDNTVKKTPEQVILSQPEKVTQKKLLTSPEIITIIFGGLTILGLYLLYKSE